LSNGSPFPGARVVRRLVALGLIAACVGCVPRPADTYRRAPVILISIDTLRADHLGAYGYRLGHTPILDDFGRRGVVFESVYSHCPLTLPAHASLLTGLLPPHHGVRDNAGFVLAEAHRTLAARFHAAGYRTGGAVSSYVLRAGTGIGRGFDAYDDALDVPADAESMGAAQRDGSAAVESLAAWIESQGDAPVFAFLHLYEPHWPYAPPEAYRNPTRPYDGDVAYADALVGRFLARLGTRGVQDRAIVAVTADHGEGLGDHGEEEHGLLLYREALHVPLLLRLPGGAHAGARVAGTAAQVDIAATLLDLAGLPADRMDGASLVPVLAGRPLAPRDVYSETLYPRLHFGWSDLYSLTADRFRFILAPRPELYDLREDPHESNNRASSDSPVAEAMKASVLGRKGSIDVRPEAVSRETEEKLAALGYVAGGSAVGPGVDLPNPRDKIGVYQELRQALASRRDGRDDEALAHLENVTRDSPRALEGWEALGLTFVRLGRARDARAAFERASALDATRPEPHLALATLEAMAGQTDAAWRHAEAAARREPGRAYEFLAQLALGQGRLDAAAALAKRSLEADGRQPMSHFVLGVVAQSRGRFAEALEAFRSAQGAALRRKGSHIRSLHASMGDCLARLGREAEAEREFLAETEGDPASRDGRTGLAMLYRSQGRDAEARQVVLGLISDPSRATADNYWTVVRTLTILGDGESAQRLKTEARSRFPSDPRFLAGSRAS